MRAQLGRNAIDGHDFNPNKIGEDFLNSPFQLQMENKRGPINWIKRTSEIMPKNKILRTIGEDLDIGTNTHMKSRDTRC